MLRLDVLATSQSTDTPTDPFLLNPPTISILLRLFGVSIEYEESHGFQRVC